jgi:hypothetical protein
MHNPLFDPGAHPIAAGLDSPAAQALIRLMSGAALRLGEHRKLG